MNTFVRVLEAEKESEFHEEFRSYWKTHPKEVIREHNYEKLEKNTLDTDSHSFFQRLSTMLSKFTGNLGEQELVIYRTRKHTTLTFSEIPDALMRMVVPVGSPAFLETPIAHAGRSTGRGAVYTRLLPPGTAYMPRPDHKIRLLGSSSCKVFIKGKGREVLQKPEPFDQFVLYFVLRLDRTKLERLRTEFSKGAFDSIMEGKNLEHVFDEPASSEKETKTEESHMNDPTNSNHLNIESENKEEQYDETDPFMA